MRSRLLRRRAWRGLAALAGAIALLASGWLLWPASVPRYEVVRESWRPSDAWLLDRQGTVLDQRRLDLSVRRLEWVTLDDVSPALVAAIVAGEDRRYWDHGGVDWRSVAGAARDILLLRRRRGASTIPMQVAQLLPGAYVPAASHDFWRKAWQVRVARGLEARWTKRQILEAYLNLLGFRGELQGVGAAAAQLAGKSPRGLDRHESAVLAALLPAPGASLERVVARACARLAVGSGRAAECRAVRAAATTMLSGTRRAPARPVAAPHVARALLRRPGERVVTTLDAGIQVFANAALARQIAQVAGRNVRDGAVLVADTQSGEVLAYVGSAPGTSRSAQVDGVRALRQAGSTLKPFLYELAIERGYVTAASLLEDSPIDLDTASGLYVPRNYDRDFKGLVSVRASLGNSLNVPAVRTLVLTGVDAFRERLAALGYADIAHEGDYYGYSLALGSAEVSLWQQAQAYRALARGGVASPLRLRPNEPPADTGTALMSPAASFVVADILADPAARLLTFGPGNVLVTPFWSAVKTGTSKDMRDNWCIGFSPRYVVAVWVGNFEGDSMRDVTGVTGAAPVWAELMDVLHRGTGAARPDVPPGVESATVAFAHARERPRREWFVQGTATERVQGVAAADAIARISSPAQATVIALDPDIPPAVQRVPIRARGELTGLRFRLDGTLLGEAGRTVLWKPRPGRHAIVLEEAASGRAVDRVHFTVR